MTDKEKFENAKALLMAIHSEFVHVKAYGKERCPEALVRIEEMVKKSVKTVQSYQD